MTPLLNMSLVWKKHFLSVEHRKPAGQLGGLHEISVVSPMIISDLFGILFAG